MQRAKCGVDELSIIRAKTEIQQRSLQGLEQIACFLPEDFSGIHDCHDRTSLLTTARSCSCLNGLVIQPVAPAFFASSLTASLDSVVRNTIGRPKNDGNARSARISSRPFMTGMFRSVMTRSGRLALAFSRPCAPSPASITLWPAGASTTLIIWRMLGESSTVRMLAITWNRSVERNDDRALRCSINRHAGSWFEVPATMRSD